MKTPVLLMAALLAAAKPDAKPSVPEDVYEIRQAAEAYVADNMEVHEGVFVPLVPLPGGSWRLQYKSTLLESVRRLGPRRAVAVLEFVQPPEEEDGRPLTLRLGFLLAPRADGSWGVVDIGIEAVLEVPGPYRGA